MNKATIAKRQAALELQAILARHVGQKPVIAGGFARDLYYGYEPKDCDLIFNQDADPKDLSGFFASLGISVPRFIPMYETSISDRIRGVYKMKFQGLDVDIIFYAIAEDESVCDYFDVNFNQFELQGHTVVYRGDADYWDHDIGGIHSIKVIRPDASAKRLDYIFNKFDNYRHDHVRAAKAGLK